MTSSMARRATTIVAVLSLAIGAALVPAAAQAAVPGTVQGYIAVDGGGVLVGACAQLLDPSAGTVATDCTDATGFYQFPSVTAGTYSVRYIGQTSAHATEYWNNEFFADDRVNFAVVDGSINVRSASLRLTGTISGQIDVSDEPGTLAVLAYAYRWSTAEWEGIGGTVVQPDGSYSLPLAAGQYRIQFIDARAVGAYPSEYFHNVGVAEPANATVVTVVAQHDTAGVDAFLSHDAIDVRRVSGSDRYATSAAVADRYSPYAPGTGVVYIANGNNFPDALSAAPAAAAHGGPLLLTSAGSLPAVVRAAIERLHPQKIKVVGGASAVSAAVYTELSGLAPEIQRLSGADRYETSADVVVDAFPRWAANGAFIATGANFPDALSASAAAGANRMPVILVNGSASTVDSSTVEVFAERPWAYLTIAGGPAAVSTSLQASLATLSSTNTVDRLQGVDRYTTAIAINEVFFATPVTQTVYLAVGTGYADALSGAAYAGYDTSPLYVVPGNCVPQGVLDEIARIGATEVVLFGGTAALSPAVEALAPC